MSLPWSGSWLRPDATGPVALRPDGPPVTTTGLARQVSRIAARLQRDGGGQERVIAVEDRAEVLACVIACGLVGDVAVLPGMMAPGALRALAEQVGSALSDRLVDDPRAIALPSLGDGPALAPEDLLPPAADTLLVRLSTSGSTGTPRLVDKTAGQLLFEVDALLAALPWPHAPVLSTVPAQHIYGLLFGVLAPLRLGVPFATDTPRFPATVASRVEATGARTLVSVPAQLRALADPDLPPLSAVSLVTSSGAPLPPETARAWHAAFDVDPCEVLGSTETGGIAWRQQRKHPTWTPLPGVRWTLASEGDDPGEAGRLAVDSPWLPPDAPRPWVTEDRARPETRDGFVLLGRADDVVKVAGKRVQLGQITAVLREAPGVEDVVVVARPDTARGQRLEALVTPPSLDLTAVRAHLREHLEPIAHPRLVLVDELPRNATGKLPRAAVLERLDVATGRAIRIAELRVDGDRAQASVHIPSAGPWFDGHLPGFPVLPGVGMLQDVVARAAHDAFGFGAIASMPRVRFQQPVRPGEVLELTLTREGQHLRFALSGDGGPKARGTLTFAAAT